MVWPFKQQNNEQEQAYQLNSKLDQDSGMQNPGTPDMIENNWLGEKPQRDDFTKWTQQLGEEEKNFVGDLKSGSFDGDGNFIHKLDATGNKLPPLMNNLGVCRVMAHMRPLTSKNLMNSNYSTEEVNLALRGVYYVVIGDIAMNYISYEIQKQNLSSIISMFKSMAKPSFLRALNDGERRHIRSFYKDIHTSGERIDNPKKKSMFNLGG